MSSSDESLGSAGDGDLVVPNLTTIPQQATNQRGYGQVHIYSLIND